MRRRRKKVGRKLGDYTVGYCRPPEGTRFKPGQCPNPKGRPKGSKSVAAHMDDALKERIVVQENGRKRSLTKAEVLATQTVNDAIKGNAKARDLIFRRTETKGAAASAASPVFEEAIREAIDWEILQDFARQIGGQLPETRDTMSLAETGTPKPAEARDE
jgi:hypothetical protein